MSSNPNGPVPPIDRNHPDHVHRPADDKEEVYYDDRPWLGGKIMPVLGMMLAGLILMAGPFLLKILAHTWGNQWAVITMEVAGLILFIVAHIYSHSIRYRISNYRIDVERGFFAKDIYTLELWHVEDLSFFQSLLGRIFGFGTIIIISHDENMPKLRMRGLKNPRPLFTQLKQRVISVKRQTGVIKVDTGG